MKAQSACDPLINLYSIVSPVNPLYHSSSSNSEEGVGTGSNQPMVVVIVVVVVIV